jgi:hypothetical protein
MNCKLLLFTVKYQCFRLGFYLAEILQSTLRALSVSSSELIAGAL